MSQTDMNSKQKKHPPSAEPYVAKLWQHFAIGYSSTCWDRGVYRVGQNLNAVNLLSFPSSFSCLSNMC